MKLLRMTLLLSGEITRILYDFRVYQKLPQTYLLAGLFTPHYFPKYSNRYETLHLAVFC